MGNEDSNFKRADDQRWREQVNDRLATLTASEVVQNDRLDEGDEEVRQLKEIIDGKASDRDDLGIKGDLDSLKARLRRIDAILWPDALGNAGLVAVVTKWVRKEEREERRAERWWKGLGPIAVAIVTSTALVLTNLDRIVPSLKKFWSSTHNEISTPQKKRSARTSRRRHVAIEAPTEATDDGAKEDVPDGRSGDVREHE